MLKIGDKVKLIKHDVEGSKHYTEDIGMQIGEIVTISNFNMTNNKIRYLHFKEYKGTFYVKCFVLIKREVKVYGISKFLDSIEKRRANVDS
jgi:hypothetical protein